MIADTPTLGLLLGAPAGLLVLLVCIVIALIGWRERDTVVGFGFGAGALVVAVGLLLAFWPLKHDYHFWVPVDGKVERTGKRIVSSSDKIQERFVVTINGQPYGVDDTRASLLRPRDSVHLKCKKSYEWGTPSNAHGWVCRWNG